MPEPWCMTDKGVWTGLAISLAFWFVCVAALSVYAGGAGFIVGHLTALLCIVNGIPAKWFLEN